MSIFVFVAFVAGVKALRSIGAGVISVDPCCDAECAAESAALTTWLFQDLKSPSSRKPKVDLVLHGDNEAE